MSKIVEITIDLTNPNCKPCIEAFDITKVGEKNIYCKGGPWGQIGRRFFIPNMNEVKYRGFLKYTYRYQTEETDYVKIMESEKTANAIRDIRNRLAEDMGCYQRRLCAVVNYYKRNTGRESL